MNQYNELIAASTSSYANYSLPVALEHIAKIGYKQVEIAAIVNLVEHIKQEDLTEKQANRVRNLLNQNGLKTTALSAHLPLSQKDAVTKFKLRMDFAKSIGASIANTNAGPVSQIASFLKNMEELVSYAEEIKIMIGLETHGDIINHGKSAVQAIKQFASKQIILNYDFANVFTNSFGKVDPADDFNNIADLVGHMHIKDIIKRNNFYYMCTIGEGLINYNKILNIVRQLHKPIHITIEIPLCLELNKDAKAKVMDKIIKLDLVDEVLGNSLKYVRKNLFKNSIKNQ